MNNTPISKEELNSKINELKVLFELKGIIKEMKIIGNLEENYPLIRKTVVLINMIDEKIGFEVYPPVCTSNSDFVLENGLNICDFYNKILNEVNKVDEELMATDNSYLIGAYKRQPWMVTRVIYEQVANNVLLDEAKEEY